MAAKKVLLLGAGFVTRPVAVELDKAGIAVTVACRTLESAKKLGQGLKHASAVSVDAVNDVAGLESEIGKNDLVISLIPYIYHANVIRAAISKKVNVVTTSYVSDAMMALDKEAKEAGITIINEIGLDPGIDHLYAVKTITEVHNEGGKINGFLSYCGGLPSPESSDNPLGYKFSWSPRGVLLAARNTAIIYRDNKKETIPGEQLMNSAKPYFVYPGFAFEAYANRDSTPYRERYDIPEAQTLIRGTLRYQGYGSLIQTLRDLGMLSEDEQPYLKTATPWKEAFAKIVGASGTKEADLAAAVASKSSFKSEEDKERVIAGLRWFGLFSDTPVEPRGNPLDCLCASLEGKMQYEKGERDMVLLQHKFDIEHKDGSKETRTSTLTAYGETEGTGGYSAMARLVGVPCAVAVNMVLDGEITAKGVLAPVKPEISEPIRLKLKQQYGIEMVEKTLA